MDDLGSLPHDHDIERALIGCCILNPNEENIAALKGALGQFYSDRHRIAARAVLQAHQNGGVDLVSVVSHLRDTGKLDDAGGFEYVGHHTSGIPRSDFASRYAVRLAELARRRAIIDAARVLSAGAIAGDNPARLAEMAEQCQAAVEDGSVHSAVSTLDMATLLTEELEPIAWTVEGLLAEGDVCVIGGEPGSGKSILMMTLALSMAAGKPFLGFKPVPRPMRVLYVDEEQNRRLASRRVAMLLRGLEIQVEEAAELPISYATENRVNLDAPETASGLYRLIDSFQPDWIFLDSLIRFHNRDENSNSAMSEFFGKVLRPMADRSDAGIVALHHLSKPSKDRGGDVAHRLRGASDIRAMVDQLWGIEHEAAASRRSLSHMKNRWGGLHRTITTEYEESGDSAIVTGAEEGRSVETTIQGEMDIAGPQGVNRAYLVSLVEAEGYSSAARLVDRVIGKWAGIGRIEKRKEGREMWYAWAND